MDEDREALIALEDGRIFRGRSFGAPGERCDEGQCKGRWSCRETAAGQERRCAATKHVSCYTFEVANIRLVSPVATGHSDEAGWNRIQLYFGESPLDSPTEPASFKKACVLARYNEIGDTSIKLPFVKALDEWLANSSTKRIRAQIEKKNPEWAWFFHFRRIAERRVRITLSRPKKSAAPALTRWLEEPPWYEQP